MKATVEISDALLLRAKRLARKSGRTLRALVEDGLRRVLDAEPDTAPYELPDLSTGTVGGPDPLERFSWQELRDEMYGGR